MTWISPSSRAKNLADFFAEVEMALGFIRAFLGNDKEINRLLHENDSAEKSVRETIENADKIMATATDFSELYGDVCDTYSALVDAQMREAFLQTVYENLLRKIGD